VGSEVYHVIFTESQDTHAVLRYSPVDDKFVYFSLCIGAERFLEVGSDDLDNR
jgi:hypothetical protein